MKHHIFTFLAFAALSSGATRAHASVVLDDHFTGNSGGLPAGWTNILGLGSAVESGTTVSLTCPSEDNELPIIIQSDSGLDPSFPTTLTASIADTVPGIDGVSTFVGLSSSPFMAVFAVGIRNNGQLVVAGSSNIFSDNGGSDIPVTTLAYAGGPITVTLSFDATSFSVATDSPAYSSGPILFSTAFSNGFTPAAFGGVAHPTLADDRGTSIIDRIMVDGVPVPEPGTLGLLTVGGLLLMRRRRPAGNRRIS